MAATRRLWVAGALLLLASSLLLGAAAEGKRKGRIPRPPPPAEPVCPAGDAACLALLQLDCDPYHANVTDK